MFIEIALPVFSPFGIAFVRNLLGAMVLWVYLFYKKISIPRDRSVFGWIFFIGLCSNIIPVVIVPFAQTEVTSSLTGIINAMSPIFAVLFTILLFKHEPVKPIQIFGILLAFFGVAIVFGIWDIESAPWWAYLFLLIAVSSFGLVAPIIAKYIAPKNYPPVALATIQVTIATAVLFPTFLFYGFNSYNFSLAPIVAMAIIGIFSTGFAFAWNYRIVALVGSSVAATVNFVSPIVAVVAGVLVLNEPITWNEPIGGVIVILGNAITQRARISK
jgi:drug/metabolite transporter (DMT)-like permease